MITEGQVRADDEIVRTRVGRHALSVADIDALLYLPGRDLERLRARRRHPRAQPGLAAVVPRTARRHRERNAPRRAADRGRAGLAWVPPAAGHRARTRDRHGDLVYLAAEDGGTLAPALAGQYITVRAAGAADPAPVRSYSLSSTPGSDTYRISVKHEPHGVLCTYVNTGLRPGTTLDVVAPRGEFVLTDDAGPVLLISAGVGATPVLAMLHQLAAANSSRDVWWIHAARDATQHAFAAEAHELLQSLPSAHERIFYTAPDADPPSRIPVIRGRPTLAALAGLDLPPGATAYLCGPGPFMTDVRDALVTLGVEPDRVHTELFGALPAINPGLTDTDRPAPHQPPGPPGTGPQVTFARNGLIVRWSGRHGSLLELADACDVPTRWSCRTGVCHTCITPILAGAVDYAPDPLEPPGPDEVLLCCARPDTDVVLGM